MLRHAGIGVAMGNAKDDVKAAAGYVTTSVDDNGIANALKQYGIIAVSYTHLGRIKSEGGVKWVRTFKPASKT